jgi:hypothetical protein
LGPLFHPLFKGGVYGLIVNNYIFNPGYAAIHYGLVASEWKDREWVTGRMGVEGNLIEYGPDTRSNMPAGSFRGPVEVYWEDNKIISGPEARVLTGEFTRLEKRPFWPEGLEVMPADKVKEYVLNNAGAFPWERDEIDQRIIGGARGKTGRIISTEKEGGGYPDFKPVIRKFHEEEWDMERLLLKACTIK